ncbi:hypothetical protein [Shinella sp.]|uniref:hypothetical protein n=1 Tax=Shinella sp. TaxID=1870904 RepID=UPI003F6EAEA6
MIGSEVEACTSATMLAEDEIEAIIHAAPTAWMSPPKFETRLAAQISRKVSFRKGARGDVRSGTGRHSFSTQRYEQSSPSGECGKSKPGEKRAWEAELAIAGESVYITLKFLIVR